MLPGFAAAAEALALGLGAAAGPQATTTPAAAMAWRNRLREIVTSRSISMPPRIRSAPDYSRRLEEHDRDRPRGRRPVHLVPRVQADELRPQPLSFFARRVARAHASHPPAQVHLDGRVRSQIPVPRGRTVVAGVRRDHDDRLALRPPEDRRRTRP